MWRNRISNPRAWCAILLVACGAGSARAAAVALISVTSPQNVLLCGRSMQLTAAAWNWYGGPVTGFVPQWQSSNPAVATVDATGAVHGLKPGLSTIQASDPATNIGGSYVVRVEPLRIVFTPARPVVHAGSSLRVSASALDGNGQPIPGARFLWTSGVTDVATVAADGTVAALKSGHVTISAALDTGSPLNYSAGVSVSVLRKLDYTLTPLLTSDLPTPPPVLLRPTLLTSSGDTYVAAAGDLSNGAQGLILISHGTPQLLASSGQYVPGVNKVINRFSGVSVNSSGDVVASVQFPSGCDSAAVLFHQQQPPVVLDSGCGINIMDRALANNGDVIYTLWNGPQRCYIHHADGTRTLLISSGDNFSGSLIAGSFGRVTLTASGASALLEISPSGASNQLWMWDGSAFHLLVANNAYITAGQVQNFQFPVESATGEIYCLVNLSTGPAVLHYSRGSWIYLAGANSVVGSTQFWWLYQIVPSGADGSIAVVADYPKPTGGGSNGVFRLGSGNPVLLADMSSSQNVTQVEGAGSGVFLAGRIAGAQGVYLLNGATPAPLVVAGWQIPSPGALSLLWDNVPERGSVTNPLMRQPGEALARLGQGAWQPVAPAGTVVNGDTINWIGFAVTSPDGKNTVFSANTSGNNAFLNAHDGRVDLIGDLNNHKISVGGQNITWIDPNWSGPFAMNSNQQFVAVTNVGSTSSLIRLDLTGASNQILATLQKPSPAGASYNWINTAAINAAGDVAFYSNLTDGSNALFLWKNGQVQKLLRTGETSLQGSSPVSGVSNFYQFAGTKLAALIWYQTAGTVLQVFDGTNWTPLVSQGQTLSIGRSIDWFTGNLAASDTGDVAYTAPTQGYASLLVRTHDGRDLVVADATQALPDGSWPIGFYGFNMTPQGDVIFVAESYANGKSHLTLFTAAPTP